MLRYFFRWLSARAAATDPFRDLEAPSKPRKEAAWLTGDEFARLLEAANKPRRAIPGLAERDRLVLLALVATGLRRSELLALDWSDLDLESARPSLLVRCGKGGKPRRQPIASALAHELVRLRTTTDPAADRPVFCGLEGGRLQPAILGLIVRRAAARAGIDKRVTAHTLRHTAATWLRQQTGDARLVAAYLGHADLSTVSRYAHVAEEELHDAAAVIAPARGSRRIGNPAPSLVRVTPPTSRAARLELDEVARLECLVGRSDAGDAVGSVAAQLAAVVDDEQDQVAVPGLAQ